jgi:LysM repeat protein
MWYRLNSLFLPDSDATDWLVEQYQDIQDICQISMPATVIRALPDYASAPNSTYLPPGTDPADTSDNTGSSNCTGQLIPSSSSGCDALSQKYSVSTGDLQAATGTDDCSSTGSFCVPNVCTLQQIGDNTDCATLASSYSTDSLNISASLFLRWNPNVLGLCDSLTSGQYVCSSPPGGTYKLPPPINGTNTDANGQVRGGQNSGANPNGPTGPGGPTANSTSFAPTQQGIASDCNKFAYASSGDTCYAFTQTFQITLAQLITWNPALGASDGSNCSTNFWVGYDYCVGTVSGSSTSLSSSSTSTNKPSQTTSLPYPTQTGIDAKCNKFNNPASGDWCAKFASDNGITLDQLYAWNSILGTNGENCGTQFQAGYDYCIGVSGASTTSNPTSTTQASSATTSLAYPTQSGLASNCNKFQNAVAGDYCSKFASDNGITTAQLYAWNPVLGANGENCNTKLQAGVDYCVSLRSPVFTSLAVLPLTTSNRSASQSRVASPQIAASTSRPSAATTATYLRRTMVSNSIHQDPAPQVGCVLMF